jgi:hypothetical protein
MSLAKQIEEQAMALPAAERRELGAKLLASVETAVRPRRRQAGSATGRVHMAADFDGPLEGFDGES